MNSALYMMVIKKIVFERRKYLDLLLLGDEQESMVDQYLDRGDMFTLFDDNVLRTVCVVTKEDGETCELKI